MKRLAILCFGYAGIVGALLFVLLLVGTQAARSSEEAILALLVGLVAPMPMLLLGVSLWREWSRAPLLCLVAPVLLGGIVARIWGQPQPAQAAGLLAGFVYSAESSQLYFFPGAVVVALLVGVRLLSERRDTSLGPP